MTRLASYHILGAVRPVTAPVLVAPRGVDDAHTAAPRFYQEQQDLRVNQVAPETLRRSWFAIGYEPADTVLAPGQFSQRGGILDVWPPAEAMPVRLEFFGDEVDTLRQFDPATQRTVQKLESLMITPASEILRGYAEALNLPLESLDEFSLPLVHPAQASILDYLPKQSLVLLDDFDLLQSFANDIEEQAVKQRNDSIAEGVLPADFPIPYLTWSELQEALSGLTWLELGMQILKNYRDCLPVSRRDRVLMGG